VNLGLHHGKAASSLQFDSLVMKTISRAILVCFLPLAMLHGQEAEKPQPELLPFEQKFLNLPQEKRDEFAKKLQEAQRLFGQKRVFETLEKAAEASAIFKDSPDLENLIGACQVEFRNFDKAMECFKKADSLAPGEPSILFNMAELNFVTKDWAKAEASLTKVLEINEKDADPRQLQLSRLIEFKLLLTKIKLNKGAEAASMATKYDYLDDSPFPYYAEAAIHFSEGRDIEGEAAMIRGARIFQNPDILSPWQDTMTEFGYVKGFFGGDADPGSAE
jgi:tetratricopeptide (TPR) repeat protein